MFFLFFSINIQFASFWKSFDSMSPRAKVCYLRHLFIHFIHFLYIYAYLFGINNFCITVVISHSCKDFYKLTRAALKINGSLQRLSTSIRRQFSQEGNRNLLLRERSTCTARTRQRSHPLTRRRSPVIERSRRSRA